VYAFQTTKLKDCEVFMELPEGFDLYQEGFSKELYCLKLNAVNGLKQSGHDFNEFFDTNMKKLKFYRSKADSCLYYKREAGNLILVVVHVDDYEFIGETDEIENTFFKEFC
jgi:hypothetical protein